MADCIFKTSHEHAHSMADGIFKTSHEHTNPMADCIFKTSHEHTNHMADCICQLCNYLFSDKSLSFSNVHVGNNVVLLIYIKGS